jgi:flagellar basal body L-ring protein FlgH
MTSASSPKGQRVRGALTKVGDAADTLSVRASRPLVSVLAVSAVCGCGAAASPSQSGSGSSRGLSADAARRALLAFFADVQSQRYDAACAMYTPAVRALVERESGGCMRNLAELHTLAEEQRARGIPDVIDATIQRVRAATFSVSRNAASTTSLGRPGTITTLLYTNGRWEINRPAT